MMICDVDDGIDDDDSMPVPYSYNISDSYDFPCAFTNTTSNVIPFSSLNKANSYWVF